MFFKKFMENFLHFPVTDVVSGAGDYVVAKAVDRQDDMIVDRR